MSESVKIAVRERPLNFDENADSEPILYIPSTSNQIIIADGRPFSFDHIFTYEHNQEAVYAQLMEPMVGKLLEGYNATALAYGQTGTGKTYTMGLHVENTNDENTGMLLRTLKDIFAQLSEMPDQIQREISISFIEIYNEKAYDLITNAQEPINVRGQKFIGGSKERVLDVEHARQIVMEGNKNRHVRPTKMNASSSRSHAVFTVYASIKRGELHTNSSLHIVDLAGSEGIRRTGHQGLALAEGVNINQGLLSIGKVLQALSTGAKVIPYRDSFLTTVLQSSLNANSYLTLLACISPMAVDISETLNTLRFAQNAKTLKNNPQINSITAECLRTIAAKTPRKSLAGQPLRAKNSFATPGAKRAYSRAPDTTISSLSTIKKPVHSNTFCTPSKLRKVDLFKQHNTTDLGHLSAGKKRKTAMPDLPRNHIVDMDDLAELQYFNQDLPAIPRDSIDSRASILSLNVSNSTSIDVAPVAMSYSPLVKRCMAEFEATIDDKLKKMFENLQNMTMGVRAAEEMPPPMPVLEARQPDNPTWDTMKAELQSIVRSELTTIMTANAVSEPIAAFKRPQSLPLTSTVRKDLPFVKRTNEQAFATRRTMDLSCLAEESVLERNQTMVSRDDDLPPPQIIPRRQSVRLSKRLTRTVDPADRRRSCRISSKIANKVTVVPEPKATAPVKKTGRVAQLKNKVIADYFHSNKSMEPVGAGRVSKKAHKDAVLELINSGSIKVLQILPTVGLKTAYQLVTHRTLKGKFKSFDEISKLPVWRGKGWQRFQQENNLV